MEQSVKGVSSFIMVFWSERALRRPGTSDAKSSCVLMKKRRLWRIGSGTETESEFCTRSKSLFLRYFAPSDTNAGHCTSPSNRSVCYHHHRHRRLKTFSFSFLVRQTFLVNGGVGGLREGEGDGDLLDRRELEETAEGTDEIFGEGIRVGEGLDDEALKVGLGEGLCDGLRKELQLDVLLVPRLDLLVLKVQRLEDASPTTQVDLITIRLHQLFFVFRFSFARRKRERSGGEVVSGGGTSRRCLIKDGESGDQTWLMSV